ncbi:MAG: YbaN family protein [Candidatus Thermoplasmatota archaeon]|nr:YbaN family protein [Candidatus Thermoplasmatota archaeon]
MSQEAGIRRIRSPIIRGALISLGIISVALGTIGIFVPLLPTTPFLLLAAACFIYSSQTMYKWLLTNRIFGRYLRDYIESKGIPLRIKIWTLLFLWGTIITSMIFFTDSILVRIMLLFIASAVTLHLFWIKTKK